MFRGAYTRVGLYSGGGAYIWNEVSVSICGGLIFGGGGLQYIRGRAYILGEGGGLIVGGLRYYLDIDGSIAKLDIDSWKEHHKISITANFVYLLRGENRYPVLKTVSIWPCI